MTDWDDDVKNVDEIEEDLIELTDIVMDGPGSGADDDIIELVNIVKVEKPDLNLDIVKEEQPDLDLDIIKVDTVGEIEEFDTEIELDEIEEISQAESKDSEIVPDSFALSSEQLESALEKVIEKQFAGKIQTILFQVMEKVIEREIAEIRDSLQKDLDQIGNV